MSLFGWSLPPGCDYLPGETEYPCDFCGEFPDTCLCPECSVCGDVGNFACIEKHMPIDHWKNSFLKLLERIAPADIGSLDQKIQDFLAKLAAEHYCSTGVRGRDAYPDASPEWKAEFRAYVDGFRSEQRPQYDSFEYYQNKDQEW